MLINHSLNGKACVTGHLHWNCCKIIITMCSHGVIPELSVPWVQVVLHIYFFSLLFHGKAEHKLREVKCRCSIFKRACGQVKLASMH